jgi:hypothetical protein
MGAVKIVIDSAPQAVPSGQYPDRLFWIITLANVTVCALLIGSVYLVLILLAAFAAGVDDGTVYVLLAVGLILTAISWPLTRSAATLRKRLMGYALNGGALLVYFMLLIAMGKIWLHITHRLFLVPAGFQGDLYVVHDSSHGQDATKNLLRKTYLFPSDGVLKTHDPAPTAFSDEYRYVYPDGHQQRLNDAGPGTLPDTSKNRANTTEVVTYFARLSPSSGQSHCSVEQISIGTRAFLLAKHSESPPPEKTHPGICP